MKFLDLGNEKIIYIVNDSSVKFLILQDKSMINASSYLAAHLGTIQSRNKIN